MKLYVASSWRNAYQPSVILALRDAGHDVYDFRHPGEGEHGFSWSEIDPDWQRWSVDEFRRGLRHRLAHHAFNRDYKALEWCDGCVLVLPSGMSAHLEAGWCAGRGKLVVVYAPELREAELMYKLFDYGDATPLHRDLNEVISQIEETYRRGLTT
ncbi:hypothetical protein SOCE26_091040 [Sorangium cellulosum]|uniref:Nucleoside 2-deoxyribosyltransferase n=1 Tax=Sorangium cellulosum TaxID=56 RepID=A0A2L0F7T7_SORCE|nr:hypothetical protein [Sorangium cellulosum]AUX47582.1 hypothetical protein SOCE26_091040 [Sorangium cellulosum]